MRDEVRAAMTGALREAGVAGVPVEVEQVASIARDSTGVGKFKLVRSET